MSSTPARLPPPDPEALEHSSRLAQRIRAEIEAAGGFIGFERYMELALYEPGLGYYAAGAAKLGPAGDFVTAPELGDTLARAIVAVTAEWIEAGDSRSILELGAGNGTLAAQIMGALDARGLAEVPYRIIEPSAELAARQRAKLAAYGDRVGWLDRLPDAPFEGVIVANEVADALPVACFTKRKGEAVPLGVQVVGDGFAWAEGEPHPELTAEVAALEAKLGAPLPDGYRSEICPVLPAWIRSLADVLSRGALLLVDYGYVRRDYYRPERSAGTLICHYRHRAHDDPFLYPGLQDLTAWVDFSRCADAAVRAGLRVAGFTTQAQWLLGALGPDLLGDWAEGPSPEALSALKTLMLPGEMGERFKTILLTKNASELVLPGRDFRSRL